MSLLDATNTFLRTYENYYRNELNFYCISDLTLLLFDLNLMA